MIFIDNISFGKKLKREIENSLENSQYDEVDKKVVMITSEYAQDKESFTEVKKIITNNTFSAKVIISTSVMDNGITIKDAELRNIILIADTETQFIQMLGRKRKDG